MSTPAPELRPLGIGEIVDVAIKLYRNNAAALLKIVAIIVVPLQILGAIITFSATPTEEEVTGSLQITPEGDVTQFDPSFIWGFVAALLVLGVLSFLGTQLATGASLKAVSDAYMNRTVDAEGSLRFALGRLGSIVWVSILVSLLAGIGFLFCIAPGVWLYASWSVAIPVLLLEGQRGWSAMSRSFNLVRGRWWSVFGALVVGYVIAAIIGFVVEGVFNLLIPSTSDSVAVAAISSGVGGAVSQTITTPFIAAVIAIIYFDLRVRKEGFDLELLATSLGSEPGPGGSPPPGPGGPPETPGPSSTSFSGQVADTEPPSSDPPEPDRPPPPPPPKDWKPDEGGSPWESRRPRRPDDE